MENISFDADAIVDSTFYSCQRPGTGFESSKILFSGKHWDYGRKTQTVHTLKGELIHYSIGHPGSYHDITISSNTFREFIPLFQRPNGDPYGIIADLGYLGIEQLPFVNVVIPFKNELTSVQRRFNKR